MFVVRMGVKLDVGQQVGYVRVVFFVAGLVQRLDQVLESLRVARLVSAVNTQLKREEQ